MTLDAINHLSPADFIAQFGEIVGAGPVIAPRSLLDAALKIKPTR